MPRRRLADVRLLQPRPVVRARVANVGLAVALGRWQQADRNPGADLPEMQERRGPCGDLGIAVRDDRGSVGIGIFAESQNPGNLRATKKPGPVTGARSVTRSRCL